MPNKPIHGVNSLGHIVYARMIDYLPKHSAVARFNSTLAITITRAVGTMWCAYAFGLFDLLSLPTAIETGLAAIISWIAQTFLQLVLLSVIMVGQNIQSEAADKRSTLTFDHLNTVLDHLDLETEGGLKTVMDKLDRILAHLNPDVQE